jgi:hypothetical protein
MNNPSGLPPRQSGPDGGGGAAVPQIVGWVNQPLIGRIDRPRSWFVIRGPLNVRGWAVGRDPMQTIELYWNDKFLGNAELGQARPDVAEAFPSYSQAHRSGFAFDAERAPDDNNGAATLRIIATTASGDSKTFPASLTGVAPGDRAVDLLKERALADTEEYLEMARSFSASCCLDDAEAALAAAVKTFPDNLDVFEGFARLAAERGNWQAALQRW